MIDLTTRFRSPGSGRQRRSTAGYTLVEILAVLVVITIMGGMVLTAVQGVNTTAKAARTRSIIGAVDSVIQEQYESYKYRALAVELPNTGVLTPAGDTFAYELLSTEAARARMLMIRDLQRMELPDRLTDIASPPTAIMAAANPVLKNTTTDEIIGTRDDNTQRVPFQVPWFDSSSDYTSYRSLNRYNVPPKLAAYRDRIPTKKADGTPFDINTTVTGAEEHENQGAECLYLVMATSFIGGQPAISSIPASNIGDTDGDGLLEILDGWGQPLGFLRWPVGYDDPQRSIDATKPDEFDPFRSDFAYVSTATAALATDVNFDGTDLHPTLTTIPWSIRPLIVSAGADGEFGIALNPWTDRTDSTTEQVRYSYGPNVASSWDKWAVDLAHMGYELGGRTAPYQMIDPFLRNFVGNPTNFMGLLLGQRIPGSDAQEQRADNITSYALQSEQ